MNAKDLIILGIVIVLCGVIWHYFGDKIPLGRLPGDIKIENGNSKLFIPITSSLIVSIIFSILLALFRK
jgi:hypothetical protein